MSTGVERARGLERDGITTDRARWNLSPAALYEEAVRRNEALLAAEGPLACRTGQHTGRSPNDKFVVREPSTEADIEFDARCNVATAHGAPRAARDGDGTPGGPDTLGIAAERQGHRGDGRRGYREADGWSGDFVGLEQCDIGGCVAAYNGEHRRRSIRECRGDLAVLGQGIVRGDDQTGFPDEAAGAGPPSLDGNEARGDALGQRR